MSRNYYEILEISRNCTQEDISNAYRRLALKYHENNSPSNEKAVWANKFHQIAESYEVLSDRKIILTWNLANKRGVYDIHGFDGLRSGILDKEGNIKGAYKYGGNAEEIFLKYFGTSNPFSLIKDPDRVDYEYGTMFTSSFGGQYAKEKEPLKNIELDFECSLEELYNGCVKKLVYQRRVLNSDGRTTTVKDEERDIEIFKGYDKTVLLTFPGYGNEAPGQKNCKI